MKRILTDNIQENVRRQPFLKASIDHLQEAFREVFTSILRNMTENTTTYFRLHGLVNSGAGDDYDISAGAVLYNGEVYQVDAFAGSDDTLVPVLNVMTTFRSGDPVKFSDNNDFNVHEIKKMAITLAAPNSGDVNFSALAAVGFNNIGHDNVNNTIAKHYMSGGSLNNHVANWNDADDYGIAHMHAGLPNAPAGSTNADTFLLIITDSRKSNGELIHTAIQLTGSSGGGAGTIYTRTATQLGGVESWGSWTQL